MRRNSYWNRVFKAVQAKCPSAVAISAALLTAAQVGATDRAWDGSVSQQYGNLNNWTPAGVPTASDNITIGLSTANVFLAANGVASNLTLNNGGDLRTGGFDLAVRTNTILDENTAAAVRLLVESGGTVDFNANFLDVLSGATFQMAGGLANIDNRATIDSQSLLLGRGQVNFLGGSSTEGLVNDGTINVSGGDLSLARTSAAVLDLDGTSESGDVLVAGNVSLNLLAPLADAFHGQMTLGSGSQVNFGFPSEIAGTLIINSPSGTAQVTGQTVTYSGTTDVTGTASFQSSSVFTPSGVTTVNPGALLTLNNATFQGGLIRGSGELRLAGIYNVTGSSGINLDTIDLDGPAENASITISAGVGFIVDVDSIDGAAGNQFDGTLTLNGGQLIMVITGPANGWTMDGLMQLNEQPGIPAFVAGDCMTLTGTIDVTGEAYISAASISSSGQVLLSSPAAYLQFMDQLDIQGGTIAGAGIMGFAETTNITVPCTPNVPVLDLDGSEFFPASVTIGTNGSLSLEVLQVDVVDDTFDGTLNLQRSGPGDLHVDVADDEWEMAGNLSIAGPVTPVTAPDLTGDRILVSGNIQSSGNTQIDADLIVSGGITSSLFGRLVLNNTTTLNGGSIGSGFAFIGIVEHQGDLIVTADSELGPGYFTPGGALLGTTTVQSGATLTAPTFSPQSRNFFVHDDASVILNTGSAWELAEGTLHLDGPNATVTGQILRLTGGTITGSGLIDGILDVESGTISPGASVGTLTVSGFASSDPGTNLVFEIAGTSPSQYDRLLVGIGLGSLRGDLQVDYLGGFLPSPGDTFEIVQVASGNADSGFSALYYPYGSGVGEFLVPLDIGSSIFLYSPLRGDANFDGVVSGGDFTIWADHFGTAAEWPSGDFSGDGFVSGADFTIWADHFGQTASFDPATTPVPEPGSWLLVLVAVAGVAGLGRVARVTRAGLDGQEAE